MQNIYNLDREFIKWFYETPFPQDGSNRAMVVKAAMDTDIDIIDYFMRDAFKQGARNMSNETKCILGDWAAAAEGLDPELVTPSEVFDRAEENLDYYYKQLFGELNES
jgi:hypothetical protein